MYHMIVQDGSLPAEFATYNAEDLLVKQEEFRKSIVMSFVKLKRKEKRRYLVYVQANRSYKRNAPCVRNYDLLYNYYEKEVSGRGPGYDEAEVVLVQNGTKVTAIDNILRKHPTLMAGYDAVLFLDDDIELNHDNIEKLFEIMSKEKLDLAQASLSEQSFCVWPAFKQPSVSSSNKRVSGVEIMMPCVSQRVLRKFGWVFGETISGFGIDLLLGKLVLEEHGWSAAVIGSVVAEHRKEINETSGAFYNYLRSFGLNQKLELWYMLEKYNLSVDFHYT